jgi:hypothetical protein
MGGGGVNGHLHVLTVVPLAEGLTLWLGSQCKSGRLEDGKSLAPTSNRYTIPGLFIPKFIHRASYLVWWLVSKVVAHLQLNYPVRTGMLSRHQ